MAELTYKALVRKVQAKEKALARNAEGVKKAADTIKELASDTASDADALGAKSVDRDSLAECQELAKVIRGVSDRAITYASKTADTAKAAKAAGDQARATHRGFQEAFDRSRVTGLEKVSRDWFEQE
ncbi:hypothetical protein [Streptomyces clavuligerus]|uniref:hypothetical protein n=1 Tax=Streptomyces clavuligerus TaxID=1901 RepID=UPI0001851785|nr:hypothetical protein [Streptomyces clavuligerus]AXU16806.1 hypothetical protein D1794_28975 [Streptomyces clavuligerus]MBY6300937.1 hypothetical protein [Streptomyces clavuligerus]QPJ97047.1 hypothetical protein GE265_28480 [Streptomyces clavuligerus]WDN55748.1 hypothetical protein LL058_28015 [Streptomyces clavuligerus]